MRIASILTVTCLIAAAAHAQSASPSDAGLPDRHYQLLREDEDWSALGDPALRQDEWDHLKFIPLGRNDFRYMTVAGEAREVWEQIGNDNWGQQPLMNGYLNERYMLSFDSHFSKNVRTFIDFKSGINSFRWCGPRKIDEKKLDFQAAFIDLGSLTGQKAVQFRIGRQQMEYGSGRLIDVREGPNVRLSFDGFKLRTKWNGWSLDWFAMRPDLDKPGFFDNLPDHRVGFWGIYGTHSITHTVFADIYYLGLDRKQAAFQRGTADELRHSMGGRIFRQGPAESNGWDFDYEGLWQFGSFGNSNISAWTFASETGYRFNTERLKPRLSAKADIASGDNPSTNTLGTFNPLFPKGNYFGVLATTGPGPLNFIDFHPRIELALRSNVSISADWIFQCRERVTDGVYAVPGFLIRASGTSTARYVGNRPGTEVRWQANRHLWFQGDYGIFYAGTFLKETQPGRDLNYWALWTGYKF